MIAVFWIIFSNGIQGQTSQLDSVIYSKNLNVLKGMVPTYYSAVCENRAKETQSLLIDLINTHSLDNMEGFKFKLAVLDSLTWIGMPSQYRLQYGLFSVRQDWIIIPGDINSRNFFRIYSAEDSKPVFIHNLKNASKTTEDFIAAHYKCILAHELGHLYTHEVLKALPPDPWTNELMANYFAFDYLYKKDQEAWKTYKIGIITFTNEYIPFYRSISDFNLKYSSVGVKNYSWYILMNFRMVEEIYHKYKSDFMEMFAKTFPRTDDQKKLSPEEILKIMDDLTGGIYSKWIDIIEGRSKL